MTSWQVSPPTEILELLPNEIHFWKIPYPFPQSSRSFVGDLAAKYLKISPQEVKIELGEHGKPAILFQGKDGILHFNLSHSGEWALLGFRWNEPLGVDIEQVRAVRQWERICDRFFSESEKKKMTQCQPEARMTVFFEGWCLHEAFVKALGKSVWDMRDSMDDSRWKVLSMDFEPGYVARSVTKKNDIELTIRYWLKDRSEERR